MATIKVTKRIYNQSTGRFEYKDVDDNTFKTYKETLEHFNGHQDWYDKKIHRFSVDGVTYYMKKVS